MLIVKNPVRGVLGEAPGAGFLTQEDFTSRKLSGMAHEVFPAANASLLLQSACPSSHRRACSKSIKAAAVTPVAASFAFESTLYGGRFAGAPNCSLVIGVRSAVTPAWRKISAANSYQVQLPALVT